MRGGGELFRSSDMPAVLQPPPPSSLEKCSPRDLPHRPCAGESRAAVSRLLGSCDKALP